MIKQDIIKQNDNNKNYSKPSFITLSFNFNDQIMKLLQGNARVQKRSQTNNFQDSPLKYCKKHMKLMNNFLPLYIINQDSIYAVKNQFLKHIQQKQNSENSNPLALYDCILQKGKLLFKEYNDFKIERGKFKHKIWKEMEQYIENSNQFKESYLKNIQLNRNKESIQLKISKQNLVSLQEQFINSEESSLPYIFELQFNYNYISESSYQWCIPPNLLNCLQEKLFVTTELFASPINHFFKDYYSLFSIDQLFGSNDNCLKEEILPAGIYEANPPFVEIIMEKSAESLINSIELAQSQNKDFFCLFVLPWKDCLAYKILTQKQYCLGQVELKRKKHCYFEINSRSFELAPFNTYIVCVGTQSYKAYVTKEFLLNIFDNFSLHE